MCARSGGPERGKCSGVRQLLNKSSSVLRVTLLLLHLACCAPARCTSFTHAARPTGGLPPAEGQVHRLFACHGAGPHGAQDGEADEHTHTTQTLLA